MRGARWRGIAKEFGPYLFVSATLILVGVVIFHKFLWRGRLLLYKDIGADSMNDYYPTFVHLSDYIRRSGFPSWSFCVGMGQNIFYLAGDLIWEPIVWLPRHLIAPALVYQHLLKTIVAGLIFFRFLQIRGLNFCSSLLGSVLLAFSAYMCMGSCWVINADEVLGFSFLLLAAEIAVAQGRWVYLPFAVGLLALITPFHLYLAALFLIFYVPARLVGIYGWRSRPVLWGTTQIAIASLIGAGLAAVIWFGSLHCLLNTPRGSGLIPNFAFGPAPQKIFELEPISYYVTAALRPFSNDILGTGDKFHGWENYFEAPVAYCGLIILLFWPQVFLGATPRQRKIYILFVVIVLVPVIFPWFRYSFWFFRGGYFRAFSLFSIFGFTLMSMRAFSRYLEQRALNYWLLFATFLLLVGFLYLPINVERALIHPKIRELCAISLTVLTVVLTFGHFLGRQKVAGWVIVLISVINHVYFAGLTVNRPTLHKHDLVERKGYNDQTIEALRDIKANERGFFRINKTWGSGLASRISYNDAMVFDYYGTMSYSSFNNLDYILFLRDTEAIPRDNLATDAQWSTGLLWEPLLSTFACEKFVITQDPVRFETADHYDFFNRYDDIYVFQNTAFVPLGVAFDTAFSEKAFLQMPKWAKHEALLHAIVLSDESATSSLHLPELDLDQLKQRLRDVPVKDALSRLQANAFKTSSFNETRITGSVQVDHDSVLLFQMPFDDGWHAKIDGAPVSPMRVDVGLLGLPLRAGGHDIELFYSTPLLALGAVVTIIAALGFALLLWRWPRVMLQAGT